MRDPPARTSIRVYLVALAAADAGTAAAGAAADAGAALAGAAAGASV